MCGIVGAWSSSDALQNAEGRIEKALHRLRLRGPDNRGHRFFETCLLGHARLSILDLSESAHQPFACPEGRYWIVFNGEIFNFLSLRKALEQEGETFSTQSDTEVLLRLFKREGEGMLHKLNGFFAFAVYDTHEGSLFLARDRYGEKPLYYREVNKCLYFGSDTRALNILAGEKPDIDINSLNLYFRLSYIPGPFTIFEETFQLMPGHCMWAGEAPKQWYSLSETQLTPVPDYQTACEEVNALIQDSVSLRLISDVPLGAFLSGGIDSSVMVACASKKISNLHTFSIGYADEPFFDETKYANLVAERFGTKHTVFKLSNSDFYEALFPMLEAMDQPFADSSALAVYILSRETRKHVTVSISGDGGDELFSGYNKHMAAFKALDKGVINAALRFAGPGLSLLQGSRQSKLGNRIRQVSKYASGLRLKAPERYAAWAAFGSAEEISNLLGTGYRAESWQRLNAFTANIKEIQGDINSMLLADLSLVLPFDMLVKVDTMSMGNSLEVRSPLIDFRLVDYVNSLPSQYKIDKQRKKKLLIDAFRADLPEELHNRPKQGFEVPLWNWFCGPLSEHLNELFNTKELYPAHLFNQTALNSLMEGVRRKDRPDTTYLIWSLLIWGHWYTKTLNS
jgi:asparagine synthase (glutamine-hydrolysing)